MISEVSVSIAAKFEFIHDLPSFLFLLDPNAQLATLHFLVSL